MATVSPPDEAHTSDDPEQPPGPMQDQSGDNGGGAKPLKKLRSAAERKRFDRLRLAAELLQQQLQALPRFVTVSYIEDGFYLRAVFDGRPPDDLPRSFRGFRLEPYDVRPLRKRHRGLR